MGRKLKRILFLTGLLMCLAACNNPTASDHPDISTENTSASEGAESTGTGFYQEVRYAKLKEENALNPVAYYRDARYVLEDNKRITRRLNDTQFAEPIELELTDSCFKMGYFACMDILGENDIAMLFAEASSHNKGNVSEYWMVRFDGEGKLQSKQAVLSGYQEKEINPFELVQGMWWCDEEGYQYLLRNGKSVIEVYDPEGSYVARKEYREEEEIVTSAFHDNEGHVQLAVSDPRQYRAKVIRYEKEDKEFVETRTMEQTYVWHFTMEMDGKLYYSESSRLWCLDTVSDKPTEIFNYLASDIPDGYQEHVEHVSIAENGEIILYVKKGDEIEIHVLSDEEEETEEKITVLDIRGSNYLQSCAAEYSRTEAEIPIQYKKATGEKEDIWTRTMAEFAAGKGPDILCISADDEYVQILQDKGILADLSTLISGETKEQIFPGILEVGTVKDVWVGVCPEGLAGTYIASDEIGDKNAWSTEDILALVKESHELEGIDVSDDGTTTPEDNLFFMLGACMNNIPFGDFADERFREVLTYAKDFGKRPRLTESVSELIKESKCVATAMMIFNASDFVSAMEQYGEQCRFMGFPGQGDYTGFWLSTYLIVVNKNSEYIEEITAFLEYVLSEEKQKSIIGFLGVREDVVRGSLYYDKYVEEWLYTAGGGGYPFQKPDGSTYIEEYVEFLRGLGPWPIKDTPIREIIEQETEKYFTDVYDLDRTIEVIDNRVQLYLDEQQ